jgi:hypothetical protein
MGLDIRLIRLHQIGCILDHQQILSVLLLSRLCEIERAVMMVVLSMTITLLWAIWC